MSDWPSEIARVRIFHAPYKCEALRKMQEAFADEQRERVAEHHRTLNARRGFAIGRTEKPR